MDQAVAHLEKEKRRVQLAKRRAINRNVPINRIPNEILGEILLLSMVPLGECIWSCSELKICHHWRQVAQGTPWIWSYLCITEYTPIKSIDLWIARSASVPLHICLTALSPCKSPFLLLWQEITRYSRRFKSLDLRLEDPTWIDHILPITFRVDNLHELRIYWEEEDPIISRTVDIFHPSIEMPQLRTLGIKTSDAQQDVITMPTPIASSLVELVIEEQASLAMVWSLLGECKRIRKLTWKLENYVIEDPWTPPSASIPTLEHLSINGSLAANVLLAADLPSLRRLAVSGTINQVNVCKAILKFTQITHLSIDFDELGVQDIRSVYKSLHHLEHFSHPWCGDTFEAILVLTEWLGSPTDRVWHCPHMKQLHLDIGQEIAARRLPAGTVRSHLQDVIRVRAESEDAPLEVILDDSEQTEQFANLDIRRVPRTCFPDV